jgi:hypothetical protein
MTPRQIPWCLAAAGFLASLTVFSWHGKPGDPASQLRPQLTAAPRLRPSVADAHEYPSMRAAAAAEAPQNEPTTVILPLPPANQPEPAPNVQPAADDQPTVDDLPARRSEPESPEGE